jgi:TolA-binding protein
MSDPFEELGALAHESSSAPAEPAVHARGRQRLIEAASQLRSSRRTWSKPLVATVLAAAAAVALTLGSWSVLRSRPISYEVRGASSFSANYLSAPADKPAEVLFSDGSELRAEAGTRLRIDETRSSGARVLVERGTTTANVKHAERSNWQFVAGPFLVHVIGTRLTLGWDPVKEEVDLLLHEGAVEVESPLARGRFAVRAGQRFRASLVDGTIRVENHATEARRASAPDVSAKPPAALAEPALGNATALRGTESATSKATRVKSAPASLGSAATEPLRESWPVLVRHGQFQAVVDAAQRRGFDNCLGSCSVADVRALAEAARYAGQSALAERSLRALRQRFSGTSESAAAAFLLGRISETRGQTAEADRWYQGYLQEAPRGQFAADAPAGRMRAVSALKGAAAAKPLASEYLQKYPDGVQAPAARKIGGFD